jgi:hypothetical protein
MGRLLARSSPPVAGAARAAVLRGRRGNRAVAALLRKIEWDSSNYVFVRVSGARGGWGVPVKTVAADVYNEQFGTSLPSSATLPGTDRTHVVPYALIEEMVCDYCNGVWGDDDLKVLTDGLFPTVTADVDLTHVKSKHQQQAQTAYNQMVPRRKALTDERAKHPMSRPKVAMAANRLVVRLNNSPDNVRAGYDSINRHIQDRWDVVWRRTPHGQHTVASPRSEQMVTDFSMYGYVADFPSLNPSGSFLPANMPSSFPPGTPISSQYQSSYGAQPPLSFI